jgi:hypothetical protein
MKLPELKINEKGIITDIHGRRIKFEIERQVTLRQRDYPEKVFVLQELHFENGNRQIRVGYYIIGKKGRARGRWVWGQFCPFFPKQDLNKLIQKAKRAGII